MPYYQTQKTHVPCTWGGIHSCVNGMSFLLFALIIFHNWNMSQALRENFSQNLKKLRQERGLKREELSLMLGFDNSYISKVEKGKVNITIDRIEKIATILEIPAEFLFKK